MTALRRAVHYPRSRVYVHRLGTHAVRILPGETYIAGDKDESIVTVLGSCVSACIRDVTAGIGGMNHFMLPESETGQWGDMLSEANRYGNFAMEELINKILKAGGHRSRLEVKLFGGANFFGGATLIGDKNASFARRYVKDEALHVAASDLGGVLGRWICYTPYTGKVARLFLRGTQKAQVAEEERRFGVTLEGQHVGGDVQLFD
ncbi:CheD [Rhodomicrobium vannielii ATCC 17100]|uniref:Probable chemoreceptor glutamine deamidase CheD n=1 Tax=Rhodomicrobium vannielii (strain ATCC 17100 / DSM 162 / LMG 4299 / NCIMB 10020 / ATH 3.1.1) TaxID=648757 RepID=E3I691_RHOVT|nr:protein CheD [Rhodomicrobium vannielii]ADP71756.1 CheD [Rhodomicrobium vannielii ATCC 17100]